LHFGIGQIHDVTLLTHENLLEFESAYQPCPN
jgi:hypothetical protein